MPTQRGPIATPQLPILRHLVAFSILRSGRSASLFQAIKSFTRITELLATEFLPGYNLFWNNAYTRDIFPYNAPGKIESDLSISLSYCVNSTWAIAAILGNVTTDVIVPDHKKGYFTEALSLRSNNAIPLQFSIPRCGNDNLTSFQKATDIHGNWGKKTYLVAGVAAI